MLSTPLRGRASEVSQVSAALRESATRHRGGLVVVTGAPGMGKSALLREVMVNAERAGFRVGSGKTDEVDQIALGAPLLVALHSGPDPLLDSALFESLEPLYDKYLWLIERLAVMLETLALTSPMIIAIDDVHWADRLTRFALKTLPTRLAESSVVWLLGSRLEPHDLIDDVLAAAEGMVPVTELTLKPLSDEDINALARDRLGSQPIETVTAQLSGVGGNPFWAVQLLDRLTRPRSDPRSDGLEGLSVSIGRRLGQLDPGTAELVRLAAVWGRPLSLSDATRLLNHQPATAILRAAMDGQSNGLITMDEATVAVSHDLLREAVYLGMPLAHRLKWHRACARQLSSTGSSLAAAVHYRVVAQLGDLEAAEALLRAAVDSANGVPEQAAELALEAFALVPAEHPRRQGIGQAVLDLLVEVQQVREAVAIADRLILAAEDDEAVAQLQSLAAQALWQRGDGREMRRRADLALQLPIVTQRTRAQLHAVRALAATRTESAPVAESMGLAALTDGREISDELTQRVALHALAEAARNAGTHDVVLSRLNDVRKASLTPYFAEEVRALQHLDRYSDAEDLLVQIRHEVQDDIDHVLPNVMYAQVWQDHDLARFVAADSSATHLLRVAEQMNNFTLEMNARMVLSAVAIYRGRIDEAGSFLRPIEARSETGDELRVARLRATQAWVLAEEGDLDGSVAILHPLLAGAGDEHHCWPWSAPWMRTFTKIGTAADDAQVVGSAVALAGTAALRNPGVATLQGIARQVEGLAHRDVDALGRAVELLRTGPRPMQLADALTDFGEGSMAWGDPVQGRKALVEAVSLFDQVRAPGRANIVRQILARDGARHEYNVAPQPRPTHGLASLTRAEVRVARLVASGHSSRSAAAQLSVSVNTVNSQLRSAFTKLGVQSRVQLANVVNDHSPAT